MRQSKIRQIIVRTLSFSPKKVAEVEEFHFEYKLWLNKGESITFAGIEIQEVGSKAKPTLKSEFDAGLKGTAVSVLLSGGEAGKAYRITCTIQTSDGRNEITDGLLAVE